MSLHWGIFAFSSPFQPALNLRSISGTSARNRGDTRGLPAIDGDSGLEFERRQSYGALAHGMSIKREYEIMLQPESEGGFSVFVPELPSAATQGETIEEPP
jgi:hypothetical protein